MRLKTRVLILPGLYNSGPEHWQSIWEKNNPDFKRVLQRDWDSPDLAEWVTALHREISSSPLPATLVAHSSACALVAHWASDHSGPVQGALLVAPSDTEAESYPKGTTGFSPMPLPRLPFRTIVVASANDEYVTPERAKFFAERWGARMEFIGPAGHINSASRLGPWRAGFALLQELLDMESLPRTTDPDR
jgi:predicted alpha/beta hydrolase family esterase